MTRYNILFFAEISPKYSFDNLEFNMILTTPSGEERINTYKLKIKEKSDKFILPLTNKNYQGEVFLQQGIQLDKTGILIIELENLMPRLRLEGIQGAGIRIIRVFK